MRSYYLLALILALTGTTLSCKKSPGAAPVTTTDSVPTTTTVGAFDINSIEDVYADVAAFADYPKWGPYNVHDPTIKKIGNEYYCYSTDVAYGLTPPAGIQVRKSADLVQWTFVGWAFNGVPDVATQYITGAGGTPNAGLWAPYIIQVNSQLRLYYALASGTTKLSTIGLATATNPSSRVVRISPIGTSFPAIRILKGSLYS